MLEKEIAARTLPTSIAFCFASHFLLLTSYFSLALALALLPPPGVDEDCHRPIIDKVNFHVRTENAATHRFG